MKCDRTGCTRIVFLSKKYAIKVPNFLNGWRLFLQGLLANLQEVQFSKGDWHQGKLCPVLFNIWGGWFLVMPKVRLLTDKEFLKFLDISKDWLYVPAKVEFLDCTLEYLIPAELKSNSFGWLKNKIVCIDYGN